MRLFKKMMSCLIREESRKRRLQRRRARSLSTTNLKSILTQANVKLTSLMHMEVLLRDNLSVKTSNIVILTPIILFHKAVKVRVIQIDWTKWLILLADSLSNHLEQPITLDRGNSQVLILSCHPIVTLILRIRMAPPPETR